MNKERLFSRVLPQFLISAVLVLSLAGTASSDTVELTGGQRVEGQVKQVNSVVVSVIVGGKTISFERPKVLAIYFGSFSPTQASPQPALLKEALQALKDLESVTRAGVTYADYTPRVSETKIRVDRYLGSKNADANIKRLMDEAMGLYVFAREAWSSRIRNDKGDQIYNHGKINLCPGLREYIDSRQPNPPLTIQEVREIAVWESMPALWKCASDRITDIEKTSGLE